MPPSLVPTSLSIVWVYSSTYVHYGNLAGEKVPIGSYDLALFGSKGVSCPSSLVELPNEMIPAVWYVWQPPPLAS